jgi:hypothetical protein
MSQSIVAPAADARRAGLPGLEFAPGTNPNGDLSSADWRFLLPRLDYGTVLFVGAPAPPVVAALARTAGQVLVASDDPAALQRVMDAARARGAPNVRPLHADSPGRLPCADGSVDLAVLCDARPSRQAFARQALARPAFADELARVLAPDGTIYLELGHRLDALRARRWRARLAARGFDAPQPYWLLRHRSGGLRMAFPLAATRAVRYAFDHVLYGTSRRAELLRTTGRSVVRAGLHRLAVADRAFVFRRRAGATRRVPAAAGPVGYLSVLAARAGAPLGAVQPGFFARGAYDSNKVAFFLFGDGASRPEVLAKMTRSPRYNHRLETEYHALTRLRARGLAAEGTYPEAVFFDHHHDLAVLAQRVVHGSPFRTRTHGNTACPFVHDAIAWIQQLGARSADAAADARELPQKLENLLDHFDRLYAPTPAEHRFLHERIASLRALPDAVPTVFQHGDAGTWNALVTEDDRVAFLDWEVSSARGVPLWDLVDFLRSFGSWVARAQGETDMVRAYATHFLAPSPLSELQAEAVRGYCARVGLPRESLEALFFSCWMQRAVREAAWSSRPLDEGSYVNLVRACIRHREAAGSRWLFD